MVAAFRLLPVCSASLELSSIFVVLEAFVRVGVLGIGFCPPLHL